MLALIDTIKRRRVIVGGIVTFSEGIRWIISIDT